MHVRYVGPALDYSGYGEANRHDIAALLSVGYEVSVDLTRHCLELGEFGELGKKINELCKPVDSSTYKIKIIHTTPNMIGQYIEPGKYHIGRVFWETDKLPPDFARGCEMLDEIWTGSEYNAQAIRNAGVTKPVYIVPESVYIKGYNVNENSKPFTSETRGLGMYSFYSIFEWTKRKNPEALLEAYWREFEGVKDVALVIKTYLDNFHPNKHQEIDQHISQIKLKLGLKHYAPLYLYRSMMSRDQIYRFHATHDCFVSAHRGEGWGIPQMEALVMGKPVISTNCGGIHEYIGHVAKLIDYKPEPLQENNRNSQWYLSDQNWASVDIDQFRSAMRWAYENEEAATEMGFMGQRLAEELFAPEPVGQIMKQNIERVLTTIL